MRNNQSAIFLQVFGRSIQGLHNADTYSYTEGHLTMIIEWISESINHDSKQKFGARWCEDGEALSVPFSRGCAVLRAATRMWLPHSFLSNDLPLVFPMFMASRPGLSAVQFPLSRPTQAARVGTAYMERQHQASECCYIFEY